MPVYRLPEDQYIFPPTHHAEEDGLLAVGGDLNPERLVRAYLQGIFPWFSPDEPILWWYLAPRCVLHTEDVRIHKSMRSHLRQSHWSITADTAFEKVMMACAKMNRKGQDGTWIGDQMLGAYIKLHELGIAHSIEIWDEDDLIGGLYGLAFAKMFCGESMFTKRSNASKMALIALCRFLQSELKIKFIDCQQETPHLLHMGAQMISDDVFQNILAINQGERVPQSHWSQSFQAWYGQQGEDWWKCT